MRKKLVDNLLKLPAKRAERRINKLAVLRGEAYREKLMAAVLDRVQGVA